MSDDDLREIFASLGSIVIRRLFSGKGIYSRGVIVAVEFGDELRLKADLVSAPLFEAAGATQWAYEGRRGRVMMPYWSTPDEAFDDPEAMSRWARLALEAGLRAAPLKQRRKAKR